MVVKRIKKTDEEAEEIMKSVDEKTNHSDHLRKREYSKECEWCKAHGYV